jgi:predicted transcriptional regulator
MSQREVAKKRTEMLKRLRAERPESVERAQVLLKEQKAVHNRLCQAIRENPKTVPEVAEAVGMPTHAVLWHLTALKKYGIVAEAGMCGEYVLYRRVEEKQT